MKFLLLLLITSCSYKTEKPINYCASYKHIEEAGLSIQRIPTKLDTIIKEHLPIWDSNIEVINMSNKTKLLKLYYSFKGESLVETIELKPYKNHIFDGYYQYSLKVFNMDSAKEIMEIPFSVKELSNCKNNIKIKEICTGFITKDCKWSYGAKEQRIKK